MLRQSTDGVRAFAQPSYVHPVQNTHTPAPRTLLLCKQSQCAGCEKEQGASCLFGAWKNQSFFLPLAGTDLLQVAAHEFGHVLGLQHTAASKSLMSPFYFFRYPLKLSEDDKQGIQYLYGKPKSGAGRHTAQEEEFRQPDIETNEIPSGQVSSVNMERTHARL